jgi:hypothetical protein
MKSIKSFIGSWRVQEYKYSECYLYHDGVLIIEAKGVHDSYKLNIHYAIRREVSSLIEIMIEDY